MRFPHHYFFSHAQLVDGGVCLLDGFAALIRIAWFVTAVFSETVSNDQSMLKFAAWFVTTTFALTTGIFRSLQLR